MTEEPKWECFSDPSYFDLWCVRRVGDRTFGQGFYLVRQTEAETLCYYLNSGPDAEAMRSIILQQGVNAANAAKEYAENMAAMREVVCELVQALGEAQKQLVVCEKHYKIDDLLHIVSRALANARAVMGDVA